MKDNLTRRTALGAVGTAGVAALGVMALLPSKAAAAEHPHLTRLDELRGPEELEDAPTTSAATRRGHRGHRPRHRQIKACIDNE